MFRDTQEINMDCSICAEKITKKRFLIECPFCEDGSVCVECAKKYVLLDGPEEGFKPGDRGCIICKKKWDDEYIEYMFGSDVYEAYIYLRKTTLLEREKSLFQITQPFAVYAKHKKEIIQTNNRLQIIRSALLDRVKEVELEITLNLGKIKDKPEDLTKIQYIMACPLIHEKGEICKGFIDITWRCNICSTNICNRCHSILSDPKMEISKSNTVGKKNAVHKCKQQDILSAKLIIGDTKPCPGCASRIQKLDGCSQMFCTNCMTAFDWDTMKIIKGVIHNPHYYDFVRDGIIEGSRVPGDIPCGGMVDFWRIGLSQYRIKSGIHTQLSIYHELATEMQEYLEDLVELKTPQDLLRDLRVEYILGEIQTEKEYMNKIYDLTIYIQQCQIEKESLETLLALFSERYRNMRDEAKRIMEQKKYMSTIRKYRLLSIVQRRKNLEEYLVNILEELRGSIEIINETFVTNNINPIDLPDPEDKKEYKNTPRLHYTGFRIKELRQFIDEERVMARQNLMYLDDDYGIDDE